MDSRQFDAKRTSQCEQNHCDQFDGNECGHLNGHCTHNLHIFHAHIFEQFRIRIQKDFFTIFVHFGQKFGSKMWTNIFLIKNLENTQDYKSKGC